MKTALFFLLTLCQTVMAEEGGDVTIWSEYFTMSCPFSDISEWKRNDKSLQDSNYISEPRKYSADTKGMYECKNDNSKYYFYVKANVCPNCYELDGTLVAGIIIGDLLVTGGVILIIYHWARRKSGASPASAVARSGPRGGQRGPAVPNRDYEVLNPRTRENATYAVAGVQRTG